MLLKTDMVAVQRAKHLDIDANDWHRMCATHAKVKAQFESIAGVYYYRFFTTTREFLDFVKMSHKFRTNLVAYYYKEV